MSVSQDDTQSAPIDRAALAEISRGDAAVERRLLSVFRTANDLDVARLQAAVDKRDVAGVIRAAHRVMGASRMAGAAVLANICATMARAGKRGDWEAIHANNRALYQELARINAYLDAQSSAPPSTQADVRP